MRELAVTGDSAGHTLEAGAVFSTRGSADGGNNIWTQWAKHAPIVAHPLSGQPGHGLLGLWQGMPWAGVDALLEMLEFATAFADETGTIISPANMAAKPRKTNHRWKLQFLKG